MATANSVAPSHRSPFWRSVRVGGRACPCERQSGASLMATANAAARVPSAFCSSEPEMYSGAPSMATANSAAPDCRSSLFCGPE